MERLALPRRSITYKDYKFRVAQERDGSAIIGKPDTLILDEQGQPVIAMLQPTDDLEPLRAALRRVQVSIDHRTRGLPSQSRVFGYQPRNSIRHDYCKVSRMAFDHPQEHQVLTRYATVAEKHYRALRPDEHAHHESLAAQVRPEYHLEQSVFTSGIVNKNNPLPYHLDKGNFPGAWSAMFVFKHKCAGGYLSVPEYDATFTLPDKSLFLFNGAIMVHGVTPIRLLAPEAYRFSVVYYSLHQMWRCAPPGEEVARIQKLRTERERKRAHGEAGQAFKRRFPGKEWK